MLGKRSKKGGRRPVVSGFIDSRDVREIVTGLQEASGLHDVGLYDFYEQHAPLTMAALNVLKRGAEERRVSVKELIETIATHGGGVPVARLGELAVWDRPAQLVVPVAEPPDLVRHVVTAETEAVVDAAGGIAATRGRDLADKGLGALATAAVGVGPVGALFFGNARETMHDGRELYLLLTDPEWQELIPAHPALGAEVRAFAQSVNRVARRLAADRGPVPRDAPGVDKVERLRQLAELRDSGDVTDAEFAQLKAEILDGG